MSSVNIVVLYLLLYDYCVLLIDWDRSNQDYPRWGLQRPDHRGDRQLPGGGAGRVHHSRGRFSHCQALEEPDNRDAVGVHTSQWI